MKTRIHVNPHNIKANKKPGAVPKPVLSIKDYKETRLGNRVRIRDSFGRLIVEFVYSPDKPLSCGATVWVETDYPVEVDA